MTVVNDYSGVGTYLTELLDIAARRVNREVLNQLPYGEQQRYHRALDVFAEDKRRDDRYGHQHGLLYPEFDQIFEALDKHLPARKHGSRKAEHEHRDIRGFVVYREVEHNRRCAENKRDYQKNMLSRELLFLLRGGLLHAHSVLDAVADLLYLGGRVLFFTLEPQLLCREVEADLFIAVSFRDSLLDLTGAVGAVEIFQNQCVFHSSTPSNGQYPSQ